MRRMSEAQARVWGAVKQAGCVLVPGDAWTLPGGRVLHARTVLSLTARGDLVASGDGLFPGCDQTYRVAEDA